ncbi:type VI secretion system tip protein TssI/VgrG [Escherichia coli]
MSTGLRFTLEVDGLPPDAFAVVSFHLNQSLSSLFSLDLSLVSQQFLSLEFQQILDKMAYLTIWQGDDVQRRVKGMVTWFELGENDKNQMLYSMKVCPPLWRTGLRQNFRIFQNEDIESILGTILQENGVTEWSPLFSEPHPSREFCVQYGETDYDFLCRMAAEEGIFFYEEHAQKSTDQSLVLCDTVRYLPESFEIPWNPNTRTEVSTLCISQFRYSAQIRPSSVVTKDYTFKRPGWAGRFDQEGQYQDYQRTQYEVYDYPGRFKGAHGQNFARWQMDGWRNNAEVARGTSRSPEIWPGRRIVLTGHAYSEQGLATRQEPDGLPPVEWLTYGSGYLAGMKLGGTPLVEYTRDRLHRETARSFGGAGSTAGYEQATAYTLTGQLQSRHLNLPQLDCDYTWNDNGQLVRISGPQECREYRYSGTGRLTGVHTTAANLDIDIPYATDPAGNRLPDPELHPDSTLTAWPDNRIAEDAHYVYRYDEYGRLAEKTDRIPEGVIRMHDERTHHYHYDSQHRLVFYTRIQHGEPQVESRYLYDPLGRRTGKRVWRRERDLTGWMSLSRKPEETWYGWDGDRLTTVQTQQTRIQTVYQPGSFTPLLRIETENGEQAKARHRSLAEVLQEDTGVTLPAELAVMLGRLERELRQGSVSEESQQWLAQCGLTAEQMAAQLEAEYIPERKLHLYHCDHRGLPLALISPEGETAWQGEYDEWGNLLGEESAQHLQQSLRLPGQQYDEESGLYYNRNRYYDPLQGRYITQDPIGLRGEWNLYKYPLNPVRFIDSLGLKFHVNGDPSDFNQAVEYLKQDSQMKETIDFLSSSEETINIEYIEGTNVRFNSNNMAIYWNSRASLFCSTELNSKSQSPALGLGHEFAHAQYYLLDKENFMALLSRTDKKYENKEEARVITIIESRAAKTLGECTRGAHSGLPFYRVDGPLQTMKITGTPE